MKPRLDKNIQTILVLGGINSLFWVVFRGVILHPDSPSYIDAAQTALSGNIDLMRTPGYPAFLGILEWIFGEKRYLCATIVCQHIVFLLSSLCLFKLAQGLTTSKRIPFILALFYVVFPYISSLNNYILTEGLSVSGTTILIYLAFQLKERGNWMIGLGFCLLLAFLLLLKPALIFMIPVFLVVWGYTAFLPGKRKNAFIGIAGVILAAGCLLGYMHSFEKKYGLFTASAVSTLNRYHIVRQYGILRLELIENERVRSTLEKSIEANGNRPDDYVLLFQEGYHMILDHSLSEIDHAISFCTKKQPISTLKALISRLYYAADDPMLVTYEFREFYKKRFGHLFSFHLSTLFLFLFLYTVLLARWLFTRKCVPWGSSLLYMIGISQIVVAVVGAQSDWGRLILPGLAAYLLMVGQLFSFLSIRKEWVQFE